MRQFIATYSDESQMHFFTDTFINAVQQAQKFEGVGVGELVKIEEIFSGDNRWQ